MRNTKSCQVSQPGYASKAGLRHTFTQGCRLPTPKGDDAWPHGAHGAHGKQSSIFEQSSIAICGKGHVCCTCSFKTGSLHSIDGLVETSEPFSVQEPEMMEIIEEAAAKPAHQ
jgi:hypothetical protein